MEALEQTERRQSPRRRVFKAGKAAFNGLQSVQPCIVRNVSPFGAHIELMGNCVGMPRRFTLFVEMDGTKVDCEVVWIAGRKAGLAFRGPIQATSVARRQVVDMATGRR